MTIIATAPVPANARIDEARTHQLPSYFALLALAVFTLITDGVPLAGVARLLAITEDVACDLYFTHAAMEARAGRLPGRDAAQAADDRAAIREHLLPTMRGDRAVELAAELELADLSAATR